MSENKFEIGYLTRKDGNIHVWTGSEYGVRNHHSDVVERSGLSREDFVCGGILIIIVDENSSTNKVTIDYDGFGGSTSYPISRGDGKEFFKVAEEIESTYFKDKEIARKGRHYERMSKQLGSESENNQKPTTEPTPKPEGEKPKWNPFGGNY